MTMFAHSGSPVDPSVFADRSEVECLIYYDGPLSSVNRLADGRLVLEHFLDSAEDPIPEFPHAHLWRTLIVPTTDQIVGDLKAGRIDYRTALMQPPDRPIGWVLDENVGRREAWAVNVSDEPGVMECLPDSGFTWQEE